MIHEYHGYDSKSTYQGSLSIIQHPFHVNGLFIPIWELHLKAFHFLINMLDDAVEPTYFLVFFQDDRVFQPNGVGNTILQKWFMSK